MDLDQIIYLVGVLFILSVIVEKFGTLYRKYPAQLQLAQVFLALYFVFVAINSLIYFEQISSDQVVSYCLIFLLALLVASASLIAFVEGRYRIHDPPWVWERHKVLQFLKFIKNHKILRFFYWVNAFKHTAKKESNKWKNASQIKELTALSLLLGFLLAFLLDVPIQSLLEVDELEFDIQKVVIDYRFNTALHFNARQLVGLLFTGFFLSFGSKFFHDLLDRLYYIKKAKEGLTKRDELVNLGSADEVVKFVDSIEFEIAYESICSKYASAPGIRGYGIDSIDGTDYLIIKTKEDINNLTLDKITTINIDGKPKRIPYRVEDCSKLRKVELTSDPNPDSDIFGCHRSNMVKKDGGQIAWPIKYYKKDCLLTCYHVVKHPMANWNQFDPNSDIPTVCYLDATKKKPLGKIIEAGRNALYEFAIIEIDKNLTLNFASVKTHFTNFKNTPRKLTSHDKGIGVSIYSRVNAIDGQHPIVKGKIDIVFDSDEFPLPDDNKLFRVMRLKSLAGTHIQQKGDSGGLVIDNNGYPIGVIFARIPGKYSYAWNLFELHKNKSFQLK